MKILILSLLRLGDIVAQEPLIQGLRRRFPDSQIHVLINDQFLNVSSICEGVDSWKGLPRNRLQSLLAGSVSEHDQAFDLLISLAEELNCESYDLIFNFTNNYLSARLMDLLIASEKFGSQFENGIKKKPSNRWEDYLNEHISGNEPTHFNLLEVMSQAFQIPLQTRNFNSASLSTKNSGAIYLQVLTSDSKKNWGLHNFQKLFNQLQFDFPKKEIKILCAESEKSTIEAFFKAQDVSCCGLVELKQRLNSAALLITGDTSVQHLAANVGCPILSLFMGSADFTKTPPFTSAANIISSQVDCYPCRHSEPCKQATHLCAEEIVVDNVAKVAGSILLNNEKELDVSVSFGFFEKLRHSRNYSGAAHLIEREIWKSYLSEEMKDFEMVFSSIKQEYLVKYLERAEEFNRSVDSFVGDIQKNSLRKDSRPDEIVKKYFFEVDPSFRSSLVKVIREPLNYSEILNLTLIRMKVCKELTNYLRKTNGRQRTEFTQEYISEA